MENYELIEVSGIYTGIGYITKTKKGTYSEKILDVMIPDNLKGRKAQNEWICTNNNRMQKICDFMNKEKV